MFAAATILAGVFIVLRLGIRTTDNQWNRSSEIWTTLGPELITFLPLVGCSPVMLIPKAEEQLHQGGGAA